MNDFLRQAILAAPAAVLAVPIRLLLQLQVLDPGLLGRAASGILAGTSLTGLGVDLLACGGELGGVEHDDVEVV